MPSSVINEGLFINGESVPATSGVTGNIINPANSKLLATAAVGDAQDIDTAVQNAQSVFQREWSKLNSRDRTGLLLGFSQLIRDNVQELAVLESNNVGKPIRESRDEVMLAANCFEYYAGVINKFGGSTIPAAAPGINFTIREPLGVCGLIIPWNFPVAITSWKVAPALAMGNTVVVKPATQTPLTALALAKIAVQAGIPPGVFNVVPGLGNVAGVALVNHPLVRKIAFTGSTAIGKEVMKKAADQIKPVTLELGGKSANIVFDDADWERVIPATVWGVLGNAGQDCCARSRVLIEKSIYPKFIADISRYFQKIKVADPLNESTEMGSLISFNHREKVQKYIELGLSEGAVLECGGSIPDDKSLEPGAYLNPTLFVDVQPKMKIAREEIFGPVLCATPFTTEEEAVSIANNSIYGLSGSVWSRDGERALRVARAVETGVISINSSHSVHMESPFGGVKASGLGKELGLAALDHYSQLKSVYYYIED